MGAAVTYELAKRGVRVVAADRHRPPHVLGSSHGSTRIIREAYFEDALYVPLVRRATRAWRTIESEAGVTLMERTGSLVVGTGSGRLVRGALESARGYEVAYEMLDAEMIRERFPPLDPPSDHVGVFEPGAGILFAERAIESLLRLAAAAGAEIRFDEPVLGWHRAGGGLLYRTSAEQLPCARIVLSAGPWTPKLLASNGLASPDGMEVERQVVAFFAPPEGEPGATGLPVVLWEAEPGLVFYSLPDGRGGVKAGIHHGGEAFDPDSADRMVYDADIERITQQFDRLAPGARSEITEANVCLYTNMPDGHFLIDEHVEEPNVIVASACSGHGFKFAPALAPFVADITLRHPTGPEVEAFRWRRGGPSPA